MKLSFRSPTKVSQLWNRLVEKFADLECSAAAKSSEAELGWQAPVYWFGFSHGPVVLCIGGRQHLQ